MKNLTHIISSLKSGEIKMVRKYYKYMVEVRDADKRQKLFELAKRNPSIDDEEACKILYNKGLHSGFSQLKKRLKQDILNILLLQDSSRRFNTPYAQAEFDVRRMIIEGDILISRGISDEGVRLLEKAVSISNQYELYSENITANEILLTHLSFKKGIKEYDRINRKILEAIELQRSLSNAKDYYHKILVPHLFKIKTETDVIFHANTAINELKQFGSNISHSKIRYYYIYIQIFYFNLKKQYKESYEQSKQFLELVLSSKAIHSKRNIADAQLQAAFSSLQLGRFKQSATHSNEALKNFKKGLINELTTLEILFLAHYYNNDVKQTEEILQRGLEHPKLQSNALLPAKWHYYKACLLFSRKKINEANMALNDCTYLLEDKTGWLYGYRILEMMIMLENGTEFLTDNKVLNFKKNLAKYKGANADRAKAILKILETLVRKHYDYNRTAQIKKAELTLLSEAKDKFLWEPMGWELIRFEQWFNSKLKQRGDKKNT